MSFDLIPHVPLRILVLSGGPSAEREISLKSGHAVANALETIGHHVTQFDPHLEHLTGVNAAQFDVAFVALHGRYGEDGGVQTQLEALGLPYTGSGPEASALAFSKTAAKARFVSHGVPTPAAITFQAGDPLSDVVARAAPLGFPVVVKPDRQGSSLGIRFAHHPSELAAAISAALSFDTQGLVEVAIAGEEWTVPLLDEQVLPPIRIGTPLAFFDYEAKYLREDTAYEFPEDVPLDYLVLIQETAQHAARSLGVTSLSRVDLRVDPRGQPWVLEVNTIPGLTDHSLAPKSAAQRGLTFAELCGDVCRRAIADRLHDQTLRQNPQKRLVPPEIRRAG